MNNLSGNFFYLGLSRFFVLVFIVLMTSAGCIRLSAKTGYWSQGPKDEYPQSRSVGFDTADYLPGSSPPGSIALEET